MNMITAIRSQGPVAPTSQARQDPPARMPAVAADGTTVRPVSDPIRSDAPSQAGATAASVATRLAERNESLHPAAEARIAADAARTAYIKASIAAGISPLPLP